MSAAARTFGDAEEVLDVAPREMASGDGEQPPGFRGHRAGPHRRTENGSPGGGANGFPGSASARVDLPSDAPLAPRGRLCVRLDVQAGSSGLEASWVCVAPPAPNDPSLTWRRFRAGWRPPSRGRLRAPEGRGELVDCRPLLRNTAAGGPRWERSPVVGPGPRELKGARPPAAAKLVARRRGERLVACARHEPRRSWPPARAARCAGAS